MTEDRSKKGVLARARLDCERRIEAGEPLEAIERYIDGLPVAPDARAALWLWALAWRDRAEDRVASPRVGSA